MADPTLETLNSNANALYFQVTVLFLLLTAVVYFFTGFAQGKIRFKVFNAEFMSQFDVEH